MTKIFITAKMPAVVTDNLKAHLLAQNPQIELKSYQGTGLISQSELKQELTDTDYAITTLSTQVGADVLAQAQRLKLIANFGAGFNNIDVQAAKKAGIIVTNTPGVSTTSVAEVTLGMYLALYHRIVEGDALMRTTGFAGWQPTFFLGHDLKNKTVGIVGMGHIGQAVAERARAFGMHILYTQHHQLSADRERTLDATFVPFEKLIQASDIVSLHAPLTADNHHLVDANVLAQMSKQAVIVNMARGPLIDEQALVDALQAKKIAGAALDVYEFEPQVNAQLKTMSNVVLTPHLGNATVEARDAMGMIVAENVMLAYQGKQPKFQVN